jgi:hypothetical protein
MCEHFTELWIMTDPGRRELLRNYETSGPQNRFADTPKYERLERWFRAEPDRHLADPCPGCGGDRWACWSRVHRRLLLAEGRAALRAKDAPPYPAFCVLD